MNYFYDFNEATTEFLTLLESEPSGYSDAEIEKFKKLLEFFLFGLPKFFDSIEVYLCAEWNNETKGLTIYEALNHEVVDIQLPLLEPDEWSKVVAGKHARKYKQTVAYQFHWQIGDDESPSEEKDLKELFIQAFRYLMGVPHGKYRDGRQGGLLHNIEYRQYRLEIERTVSLDEVPENQLIIPFVAEGGDRNLTDDDDHSAAVVEKIRRCMEQLSSGQRKAIEIEWEAGRMGKYRSEVARERGLNPSTIDTLFSRAQKKLCADPVLGRIWREGHD